MARGPQNPYYGMPIDELAEAMHARMAELQARRPRTPEEREALAGDTAMMLGVAARDLFPGRHAAGAPERDADSALGLAEAFARWNDELVRAARHRVLTRAASAALGAGARTWVRDTMLSGQHAYDVALASDEGLRLVLEALEGARASGT